MLGSEEDSEVSSDDVSGDDVIVEGHKINWKDDLTQLNLEEITTLVLSEYTCYKLRDIDIGSNIISKIQYCTALTTLDISGLFYFCFVSEPKEAYEFARLWFPDFLKACNVLPIKKV